MTVAGGALCRGCRIHSASHHITLPAGGELLRCQWCADKLAAQGATVTPLPERAPQHRQASLPVVGGNLGPAGPAPSPSVRARAGHSRKWPPTAVTPSQPSGSAGAP